MRTLKKLAALALVLLLLSASLSACGSEKLPEGAAPNDILTFTPNYDKRPIIRIAIQYHNPDTSFYEALQREFPDYLIVLDYGAAAGNESDVLLANSILNETEYYDFVIGGNMVHHRESFKDLFVDLSAEHFLDRYHSSALIDVSVDGRIYHLPATSTLAGIAYNVDMFEANGWEVPKTQDEFFALCEVIKATGVRPFTACLKYTSAAMRLLTMMNYSEVFKTADGVKWMNDIQEGNATFEGWAEPLYRTVERFRDGGILGVEEFSASLTKQRMAFWAGETAMIDYESTIFTYAEDENAPFTVGIMPYPSSKMGDAGFSVTHEYYFAIPKYVEKNPDRLAVVKKMLEWVSSEAGQQAMISDSLRISNIKGITLAENAATKYAREAYERGNLYPIITFSASTHIALFTVNQNAALMVFEGASADDAVAYVDTEIKKQLSTPVSPLPKHEVIASAAEDFTILETSYYIADKFLGLTGSEIAFVPDRGFFRSNLARIVKGDITSDMRPYVLKGVGASDFLCTYELTGAKIKEFLEHPIVNGTEIDSFIASAGLKIEYAPWNPRGSRVLSVTLPDGSPLDDSKLYLVAAWAGVIDDRYIAETVKSFDELGGITDIMLRSLKADKTVAPNISDRLTLVWDKPE